MTPDEERQPLTAHLAELKKRLTYAVIALIVGTVVSAFFVEQFIKLLTAPVDRLGVKFQFIHTTGFIGPFFEVALRGGFVLSLPVIVYQVVMFIRPGLLHSERRWLYISLPVVALAFLAGVAFGYFVLLPPAIGFLFTFGSDIAEPRPLIGDYISTMLTLLFWMGVVFETPFLFFLLARLGVLSPYVVARQRRLGLVAAFVLGAVITPTGDPINMTVVAVPVYLLFELGILLGKIGWRLRRREAR